MDGVIKKIETIIQLNQRNVHFLNYFIKCAVRCFTFCNYVIMHGTRNIKLEKILMKCRVRVASGFMWLVDRKQQQTPENKNNICIRKR